MALFSVAIHIHLQMATLIHTYMEIAGENEKEREERKDRHACMSLLQPLMASRDEAIIVRRQSAVLPIDGVGLTVDGSSTHFLRTRSLQSNTGALDHVIACSASAKSSATGCGGSGFFQFALHNYITGQSAHRMM